MKKSRKMRSLAAIVAALLLLAGCAAPGADTGTETKVFRSADSWLYPSLNPHVDYQGWQEFGYGGIEMLFHIEADGTVAPWLAAGAESSEGGRVWTITLRDGVRFSDGTPLTAEMTAENLKDLAEKNGRYGYLKEAQITAADEKTVTVALAEPYLTLPNDLADPDTGIVKMGPEEDIDQKPITTGPFRVESFQPEKEVVMVKNEQYWNGEAQIDKAIFTYVPDPDTQLMAFQNGEASVLSSPTAAALEMLQKEPDRYTVCSAATSRLYFYYLNCKTLSEPVRKAINLAVDPEEFAQLMNGMVQTSAGPFLASADYGKAEKPARDPEAARQALEADGYRLNQDGYYEKDGSVLSLQLCYYPARSLDKLAALMQQQLRQAGILAEVSGYEDPDSAYVTTGNFDIGLYNVVAAPSGDPYYFLDLTMGTGSYNAGGYENPEVRAMLQEMAAEPDSGRRAELANKIVQTAIDDNAYGYIGHVKKITVLQKGVSQVGEDNPYHGGLNAESTME